MSPFLTQEIGTGDRPTKLKPILKETMFDKTGQ